MEVIIGIRRPSCSIIFDGHEDENTYNNSLERERKKLTYLFVVSSRARRLREHEQLPGSEGQGLPQKGPITHGCRPDSAHSELRGVHPESSGLQLGRALQFSDASDLPLCQF